MVINFIYIFVLIKRNKMDPTKEQIWHMIKYVLEVEDELEIASWTKALLDLKELQKKVGHPTKALLTIDDEQFTTTSMAIYPDKICMTTNSHEKRLKEKEITPDIHVLGDVTIEECTAPLQVHGNVFSRNLKVNGNFNPEKFVNFGHVTIYCNDFCCDDITVSGIINIHAKKVLSTELKANTFTIFGDVESSSFINADNLVIHGNVNSTFVNNKNNDNIIEEINNHFNPNKE